MLDPQLPNERPEIPGAGRDTFRDADLNADTDAPLGDREVPIPGAEHRSVAAEAVHAWLDDEASEDEATLADAKQVQFWAKITEETERRRRMVTPAHVPQKIMDALPSLRASLGTSAAALDSSIEERLGLTPAMAAFAAVSLLAAGFLLGRLIG